MPTDAPPRQMNPSPRCARRAYPTIPAQRGGDGWDLTMSGVCSPASIPHANHHVSKHSPHVRARPDQTQWGWELTPTQVSCFIGPIQHADNHATTSAMRAPCKLAVRTKTHAGERVGTHHIDLLPRAHSICQQTSSPLANWHR